MRCAPQVHGAARDAFGFAHDVFAAEANAATDNPMVFAGHARDRVRRQLSRRAGRRRRRSAVHRPRAAGDDQRAAIGSAGQSGVERPAGVPHATRRPAVGADDGAGDRRRADVGAEDAGTPGQRRHDSDIRQQGGSRQHEHGRGAEGGARRRARAAACSRSKCCARVRRSICLRRSRRRRRSRACTNPFARACRRLSDDRPPSH